MRNSCAFPIRTTSDQTTPYRS